MEVDLDLGGGGCRAETGVGFLDHMLEALSRHGGFGLRVDARGDLHVDAHHTVEDVGLVLGDALDRALCDRSGVRRFGFAYAPLDEALARAVVDLSGRPFCRVGVPPEILHAHVTPEFPVTLAGEFFRALATRSRMTLHLDVERAVDPHHAVEAMFKAAALAMREACSTAGADDVPSTKGTVVE